LPLFPEQQAEFSKVSIKIRSLVSNVVSTIQTRVGDSRAYFQNKMLLFVLLTNMLTNFEMEPRSPCIGNCDCKDRTFYNFVLD